MSDASDHLAKELERINARIEWEIAKAVAKAADKKPRSKHGNPEAQAAIDALEFARKRLLDFNFSIFGQIQCPECFIWRQRQVTLQQERFAFGATILTCPSCGYDLRMPQ